MFSHFTRLNMGRITKDKRFDKRFVVCEQRKIGQTPNKRVSEQEMVSVKY